MAGFASRDARMNYRPQVPLNRDLRYPPPQQQFELPRDADELLISSRESNLLSNNPDCTVFIPNQLVSNVPLRPQGSWNVRLREQLPFNYSQLPQILPAHSHRYFPPLTANYPTNVEHPRLNETSRPIRNPRISLEHQENSQNTQPQFTNLYRSTFDNNMRGYQFDPSIKIVHLIWKKEFETHAKNIVYIDNSGNSVIMNNYPTQPDRYEAEVNLVVGEHFGQLNILGHELFETHKYFVEEVQTQQNILLYLKSPPYIPQIPFPAHFPQRLRLEYNIAQHGQANEIIIQLQRQCNNFQEDNKKLRLRSTNISDNLNAEITSLKGKNQQLKQESTQLDEALVCKILEFSELEKTCSQIKKYENENSGLKEGIFRINELVNSITNEPHAIASDLTAKYQLSNILRSLESWQSHNEIIEKKLINDLQLNSQASLEIGRLKQELHYAHQKIQELTIIKYEKEKLDSSDEKIDNSFFSKESDKSSITNPQQAQAKEPKLLSPHKYQEAIRKDNELDIQGHKDEDEIPKLSPQKKNQEEFSFNDHEPKKIKGLTIQNKQKEIPSPLKEEIIKEEIAIPLNEEKNQKEIPSPLKEEIIQEEIAFPLNEEKNQMEIPILLNEEKNQKEIPSPLKEEIIQEKIAFPLNEETNQKEIPIPLNEENNQKEIPIPLNEEKNQKQIPIPLNEEKNQREMPIPLNEEINKNAIVIANAKMEENNQYKLKAVHINKLKTPELFTNVDVNKVKPGCFGFKVKIKEVETTLCKITRYSYANPNDFIGQEVFCRPTNRDYECGMLRVIFPVKVFTSTVHRNIEYAGIEFHERVGNSDGCYKGNKKQYFQAEAGYAVFLPLTDISVRFKVPIKNTD